MSQLVIPGTMTATSLTLPADLTFEQWQAVCEQIGMVSKACLWWWGDALNYGEAKWGEMYAQALDESDYEYQTLRAAKYVSQAIPLLRRRNNLSFSHHREVAALPPNEADALLDAAEAENQTRDELRRAVRALKAISAPAIAMPAGLYSVILADPPWRYDFSPTDSRQIENQYPTLDVADICALQVPAADDAVLFMWATAPKLPEAMQVLAAWGFNYVTHAIWDKEIIGMGYWFRGQHELLIVATKGQFSPPPEAQRVSSVMRSKRGRHSEKPDLVHELIEKSWPALGEANRLEMFARRARPGWTLWGNEVKAAA